MAWAADKRRLGALDVGVGPVAVGLGLVEASPCWRKSDLRQLLLAREIGVGLLAHRPARPTTCASALRHGGARPASIWRPMRAMALSCVASLSLRGLQRQAVVAVVDAWRSGRRP